MVYFSRYFKKNNLKVRDYKEMISSKFVIPKKFIILMVEDIYLEDDKYLSEYELKKYEIKVMIEVIIGRVNWSERKWSQEGAYCAIEDSQGEGECRQTKNSEEGESLKGYKYEQCLMNNEDTIKDLKLKYSSTMTLNITGTDISRIYCDNTYLRESLKENNGVFYIFFIIKLEITNEYGEMNLIEVYENDTVKILKTKISKQSKELMKKNDILSENKLLYEVKGEKLFISFNICVKTVTQVLSCFYVNYNTSISRLKELISVKYGLDCDLISLTYAQTNLSDEKTVGFYEIRDGDELFMEEYVKVNIYCENKEEMSVYMLRTSTTVLDIKKELSTKYKVKVNTIKLKINERELGRTFTLGSLEFQDDVIRMEVDDDHRRDGDISLRIIHSLQSSSNDSFNIIVPPNISVEHLRNVISKRLSHALCDVDIYFLDQEVKEGTIDLYSIKDKSILTLERKKYSAAQNNFIIVQVKSTSNGDIDQYSVNALDTVRSLKCILRDHRNVSLESVKLYFKESELKDDAIFSQLHFEDRLTFTLVIEDLKIAEETKIMIRIINYFYQKEDGDFRDIVVDNSDTIDCLIQKSKQMFSLSEEKFILNYQGEVLKKEIILRNYNIKNNDEIELSRSVLVNYLIDSESSFRKVHRYSFFPQDKVIDLMQKIFKKIKIEPRFIHLTFNGSSLEGETFLEEAGVENESYLFMISTLLGGL